MKTLYLPAAGENTPALAAELLKKGELVALPTETVYGLGANGLDPDAVAKIFAAKGRPQDNPLILHIAEAADMEKYCHHIPEVAYKLAEKFWPGPLTMVLPAKECVPKCTTAGLPTVAVRCPDNTVTREIIRLSGVPIAAPSANISGKPSTTTAEHVLHDHEGKIPMIVDGGPCRVGVESTIIDLSDEKPRLLRPGGITPDQLAKVVGDLILDKAITESVEKDAVVKAPGMKYKHYAPACRVIIVDGELSAAAGYVKKHFSPNNRVLCFEEELEAFANFSPLAYGKEADPDSLMAGLFAALRELDDPAIGTVFARCPQGTGKALAVQNRLGKAAGFYRVNAEEKSFIIGITGGTGCGKTTLLQAIADKGGLILDCDAIYHSLLASDPALLQAIEDRFPGTVADGALDRKKLGTIVFADEQALADLNRITHSAVKQAVLQQLANEPPLAAIDAIGLFEGGLAELCDVTVAVTAPTEDRIRRIMLRDGISRAYAEKRIAAQHDNAWFARRCDYTLENSGDKADCEAACLAFLHTLGIM